VVVLVGVVVLVVIVGVIVPMAIGIAENRNML